MKNDLEKKLEEIVEALRDNHDQSKQLGVLAGTSGISLFFFHYARYRQDNKYAEVGNQILEDAFDKIVQGYAFPTYCSGIAGTGWVFEYLWEQGFLEIDNDEVLPDLDGYLYLKMKEDVAVGHYDYLHGAIGYGLYFLKRFKNTRSDKLKTQYQSYLNELLDGLSTLAERDKDGLKWLSEMKKEEAPEFVYNLSLSHGISSIVNFLARVYECDCFRQSAEPLLRGSINYLLAQEKPVEDSLFPSFIAQTQEAKPARTRMAWCYGDLGIGISLYKAGQVLGDSELLENATRILRHTTKRRGLTSCSVVDASPCHGAFGIAQIYDRMFRNTRLSVFSEARDYWMQEGLNLATYEDGYAGYKQQKWKQPPANEVNLLEGIAGIGLTIISFLSPVESNWEESLMIN